jgi:hypothetical protein
MLHGDLMLLVGPAAGDYVIYPSKGTFTAPDGPVHMPLVRRSSIPQPKGHPLILEEAKKGGDGCLLHFCWVDQNLVVALPQINLGKKKMCNLSPSPELKHVGQWVDIWLSQQVEEAKITVWTPPADGLPYHVDQREVDRWMIPSSSSCLNFTISFLPVFEAW